MVEKTSITGPIEIKDNSPERVAFDLFNALRGLEAPRQDELLEFYARCLLTVGSPTLGVEAIKKAVKSGLQD